MIVHALTSREKEKNNNNNNNEQQRIENSPNAMHVERMQFEYEVGYEAHSLAHEKLFQENIIHCSQVVFLATCAKMNGKKSVCVSAKSRHKIKICS